VPDAALLRFTRSLTEARDAVRADVGTRGDRLRVIVNKRVDVALAAGADGVQLGFDALDVSEARALLGRRAALGRSLHSVAEVREETARNAPADYVHLAPIWNPNSKPA
jgi:thiamine-phosphate pyrophosphorylase